MELFENLELSPCAPRPLHIVTPLGAINSNIVINSQLLSAANISHFYSLQTGGFAARWDLSLGIAEVIVTRPALIAEYRAEITDCWAFLWRFKVLEPIDKLAIQAAWLQGFQWKSGGPSSGQWLDAQTWDDEQTDVSLGTEEGGDALFARAETNNWFPPRFIQQSRDHYSLNLLRYETKGMIVDFRKVRPNELFQTHFVVAWSQYVDESIATWNAVDLDAKQIIAGAAGETVWPQCE